VKKGCWRRDCATDRTRRGGGEGSSSAFQNLPERGQRGRNTEKIYSSNLSKSLQLLGDY